MFMKKLITFIFILTFCYTYSQNKSYTRSLDGVDKVIIESSSDLIIKPVDSTKLFLQILNDTIDNKKVYYQKGKDITNGLGFRVMREDSVLKIIDLRRYIKKKKIIVSLPKSMSLSVFSGSLGSITIDSFESDLEVISLAGSIDLQKVTGPITASSVTGDISTTFTNVDDKKNNTITSMSGEIEVTISSKTKVDLYVKTLKNFYTNFNLKSKTKLDPQKKQEVNISGEKLNGGGSKLTLRSSRGNIYLKKI